MLDETEIRQGFADLDQLSWSEYHQAIRDVLSEKDVRYSTIRIGRLVGVVMKEPFATATNLEQPSRLTNAYRAWDLKNADCFERGANSWQYKALSDIRVELALNHPTLFALAQDAQSETGFFGYFAQTISKYLCNDKVLRKKVEDALKASGKAGAKIPQLTPEAIVGAGGLSLGVLLVQSIPVMGIVGAPVVAAVVVILYRLGVEAFCDWSIDLKSNEQENN
jgi:hypothetical protein